MLEEVLNELKRDLNNYRAAIRHHEEIVAECKRQAERTERMIAELKEAREKLSRFDDVKKLENCLTAEFVKPLDVPAEPGKVITPPTQIHSVFSPGSYYHTTIFPRWRTIQRLML